MYLNLNSDEIAQLEKMLAICRNADPQCKIHWDIETPKDNEEIVLIDATVKIVLTAWDNQSFLFALADDNAVYVTIPCNKCGRCIEVMHDLWKTDQDDFDNCNDCINARRESNESAQADDEFSDIEQERKE